ncbi:uncharacterized protein P884DRAFT_265277 [Thermothelomyces heterothallicus CBS 202.75]|uniref:uncharacterized protein n=1 Tax=Thermothelomyces heterothallicus CBS 202.75 TaxID=1149848 RepID=UPI003742F234
MKTTRAQARQHSPRPRPKRANTLTSWKGEQDSLFHRSSAAAHLGNDSKFGVVCRA